jgi:hypothetical protein
MEKDRRIQSARQGDDGILDSQVEMGEALESRRMLEEALKSAEVDRRGLPRDDGQLKAWEV